MVLNSAYRLVTTYPIGVDVEIPLDAAGRWLAGNAVYPPSAFDTADARDLPFLYPPYVLPLLAPLTLLPFWFVTAAWIGFSAVLGYAANRRLGLGPLVAAVTLLWPPYLEALLGGNVQVVLFAAFVFLLVPAGPSSAIGTARGVLAASVAALKVSQLHPWLFVLGRDARAALGGILPFVALALLTLPMVGVQSWFDWFAQALRSGDPEWPRIGAPLSIYVGRTLGTAITVATFVAAIFVPVRHAAAWLGILLVVGAPALHEFQLVFLLPALLLVRREVALAAAALVATFLDVAIWAAVGLVAWALLASYRWPSLRALDWYAGGGQEPVPPRRFVPG